MARDTALGLLPMVATGFLRLVTHPKVFLEPTPEAEAWRYLEALRECPGVEALPLGPEWQRFRKLCRRLELAGNDVLDAWIAAAAREHRMPVVTLDRGFTRLLPGDSLILLES